MKLSELVRLIEDHDGLWLGNSDLKYLTIVIDTRATNERYTIRDRDGNDVNPLKIVEAAKHKYAKTHEKADQLDRTSLEAPQTKENPYE